MTEKKIKEIIYFQLEDQSGRLDKVLVEESDLSRTQIQSLIKQGLVTVNGQVEKANYKLSGKELIEMQVPEEEVLEIEAQAIPLDIIYEDDDLLVINKEAGMVVHPSKGHPRDTLVNALVYHFGNHLAAGSDSYRPGLVHRIDKDTSGLLVVAKNNESHRYLSQQLMDHTLGRIYYCLVEGQMEVKQGSIEIPLARDPKNRLKYHADAQGKPAWTDFEVLESYPSASLIQAELKTGRTHQIRAHFEHIGHPIIGDPVYNRDSLNLWLTDQGQFLHAGHIHFIHPRSHELIEFHAPLPASFINLQNHLKSQTPA